ncbi:hypothetical protein QEN71_35240 [Paraburkholderia sabiae]|uniref:hypothetical protein n=1 Tax=Paraburkholderia sabiae TaxID=273251 RepID=UPI0025B79C67|nr:hypothetical protein [Paraburkholderia sabiae]WJZ77328.1 hypothetical protein QEN71_35240 [Paraburkholderia sabiae]
MMGHLWPDKPVEQSALIFERDDIVDKLLIAKLLKAKQGRLQVDECAVHGNRPIQSAWRHALNA